MNKKSSKAKPKRLFGVGSNRIVRPISGLGKCWWDFDEQSNISIECEHPPHNKHYLLTFKTPKGDASDVADMARKLVNWLNGQKV